MPVTLSTLSTLKSSGQKFTCLTAYDATFSQLVSQAGVEVILVGDSLGMVLQGQESTVPVTVDDMAYHTRCVARGNRGALIMADMPFMSYVTLADGLRNATTLMQAGAHLVKLEGGRWLCPLVEQLANGGTPVCVHLGLTPQSVNKFGGYKVQGRDPAARAAMIADAVAAEEAGAALLLFECIPTDLTEEIMARVSVPVIGIGAGAATDGQVLVMHDMLGVSPGKPARFVRNFMGEGDGSIKAAIEAYVQAVKGGLFPADEHGFA